MELKPGKIDSALFEHFIAGNCGASRDEVLVKPQFGVDVSLVELPGNLTMALTSDPLSLVPSLGLEESAWLSVHLMANDMATTGFAPMYGQFVLNLPDTLRADDFKTYWSHIDRFCKKIGLAVTGGHTGFIPDQNSTIAGGGTLISVAPKGQMLTSNQARVGDCILVTKSAAISSAAILALSFPDTVSNRIGPEIQQQAAAAFYSTSVLEDALRAAGKSEGLNEVTAMHDVTEGGILGSIYEMAFASGHGVRVDMALLPLDPVQAAVCRLFELDPFYCIGAGAMIISCPQAHVQSVKARLAKGGIPCTQVGEIAPSAMGMTCISGEKTFPLVYQEVDPYWAAYFTAMQKGWT
jgi:hydrogenase expression/formation protein HypE